MPDDNGELHILIKTLADTFGIEQVNQQLHKLTDETKNSGTEVEKHNSHHREMRRLFREMNKLMPESGHLLHGLFAGPQILLILGAVAALHKFVELLKEQKKHTEELLKVQTDTATAVWVKSQTEMKAARDEVEKFNLGLEATARSYDVIKDKQQQALAILGIYNAALVKSAGDDKVRGEELERQAEGRKQLLLNRNAAEQQAALQSAQDRLETAQHARAAGAPGGEEAARAESSAAYEKTEFDKAQAKMQKLLTEKSKRVSPELLTGIERVTMQASEADFNKRFEEASLELATAKNRWVASNAAIDAHKRALDKLTEAEKEAEEEVKRRTESTRQARQTAGQNFRTMGAKMEAETEGELTGMGLKGGSVVGHTIMKAIRAGENFGHGGTTHEDDKVMSQLVNALRYKKVSEGRIYEIIKELANSDITHEQKMTDVLKELKVLKQQIKSTIR